MIPCSPGAEPNDFDAQVRKPGRKWLAAHPKPAQKLPGRRWRPLDYWSPFRPRLGAAFGNLCAYGAMYEPGGTVDHFTSCDADATQAYEWTNYRFASQWINSSKQTADDNVMDPCEVQDGWFEISLPDLQLRVTDAVPPAKRQLAEDTLIRLHLRDDERVMRQREEWYRMYRENELTLAGLMKKAPLIAKAVEKALAAAAAAGGA